MRRCRAQVEEPLLSGITIPRDEIDDALVHRLIASQFPQWSHLPEQRIVPGGWDNRTFRLGDVVAVRLPAAEAFASQVEREQRWLPYLAPFLPLPIPVPLARGVPGERYPWEWSIYRWIEGESLAVAPVQDLARLARDLADVILALHRIDPTDAPEPRPHDYVHGGPLRSHDDDVQRAIDSLDHRIDIAAVREVWDAAMATTWHDAPVWVHGDLTVGNLLVRAGRLRAVIDWGCSGVGDPACDLVVAWTLLADRSRKVFHTALQRDAATWARGRGWALWKALTTLDDHIDSDPVQANRARHVIDGILRDHRDNA